MRPAPHALLPLACALALSGAGGGARAGEDEGAPVSTSDPRPLHAISLYGRGLFMPNFLLGVGLAQSTELSSGALGASYTYRRGSLDIVTSLDLGFYTPPDGNFLAVGKDPTIDTHYTRFNNLNFLSLDVSFYWVHDVNRYFAFVIGGGVGLGALLGDVYVVNNQGTGCVTAAGDPAQCHPVVNPAVYTANGNPAPMWTDANGKQQALSGPLMPSDPDFSRKLDGLSRSQADCVAKKGGDCRDTAEHPYYHSAAEKPPLMVVINFQLGFKIKLQRHFNLNLMGGFRDGFVFGGGPEYVF